MSQASAPSAAELLSEAEVQRLLMAASERAPTGVRNRALVALLYCSGLRLEEALALRSEALDLAAERVTVGGRRARKAHLYAAATPYLETWLALRPRLSLAAAAPLFCTLPGEPLEPAYVRALLTRLARRAGLKKRVHAHLLRHSFAARLNQAGLATAALAEQLGLSAERGAVRALDRYGLEARGPGAPDASSLSWSLAPEPGSVRVRVRWIGSERPPLVPRQLDDSRTIVVRRWRPTEI